METEIFILCDYAQDMNGKLTIVGTFDAIGSIHFPFKHPHCSIAARLRFAEKEIGKHKGCITFKDPKGTNVVPNIDFELDVRESSSDYTTINFVIGLGNLDLKLAGKFKIELHLDDDWKSGLTLNVTNLKQAA